MNMPIPAPNWSDEPVVMALLHALVDRLDSVPFEARLRDLTFALTENSWRKFFAIDHPSDRTYIWQLVEALTQQPGFELRLDDRRIARDLDLWQRHPKIVVKKEAENLLRNITGRHPAAESNWIEEWKHAVQGLFGTGLLASRLATRPVAIYQRPPAEVLKRFAAISDLADACLMLHEVASRQFWGLSKILNGQQDAIALLLSQDFCPFPDKPIQLVIQSLTADTDAPILFIENAATFESAASGRISTAQGHILIYASGYKATARRIRTAEGSSLYFAPEVYELNPSLPRDLQAWLYSGDTSRSVYFWGDLDFAGMDILKELRVVFRQIEAWRPGYEKLLEKLTAGESHTPEEARKSGQTDPILTGCPYADGTLLPEMRNSHRFVDQESL